MNIAYVCADLGIPVLGNKGASVHVREFSDALVALGHTVRVISAAAAVRGDAGAPGQSANIMRAPLTVVEPSDAAFAMARSLAAQLLRVGWQRNPKHLTSELDHLLADGEFVQQALPILRQFQPDLLIARHAIFSVAGQELAHTLGCPYVLEVNAPLVEERRRYWELSLDRIAEVAERTAFADVDLLVAVSEGVRNYVLRCGAPKERVVVLPNGVDVARFSPDVDATEVRRRYGLEGRVVLGFAGSLKPWHGVDQLMRAFANVRTLLAARSPRSGGTAEQGVPHLLIIGDGPQRAQLSELSQELQLGDAVTFTGTVAHHEVPAHLAAIDIAVAPYLASDGFYFSPLKVMEYLAMGRAIVAPALGQIPSLLQGPEGVCGLLYQPDDMQGLTTALLRLARDGALRQTLGTRAAAQARRNCSWQTVAQQIITRAMLAGNRTALVPSKERVPA